MRYQRSHRVVLAALMTLSLVACSPVRITFVENETPRSRSELQTLLSRTEVGSVATSSREEANRLRRDALAELRSQGGAAATAADTITRSFPAGIRSVPVYVELVALDDVDALVVVEATVGMDGRLSDKRLWALDAVTGDVLFSAVAQSR